MIIEYKSIEMKMIINFLPKVTSMKDGDINRKLSNKKIMIIDECKEFREIISSICSYWGASTVTADSSEDVVFQVIRELPDLIIFHPGSERRSAFYSCKFIKCHEKTRHIPILLTTGDHSLSTYIDDSIKFDDFILKPFVPEELEVKLEKLLIEEDGQ